MQNFYEKAKKDTKDFYNKNAKDYFDKTFHAANSMNIEFFSSLIDKNGFVLDLGCGTGRDSLIFKNKGFKVSSIDVSEGLAKIAKEEYGLNIEVKDFSKMTSFGTNIWSGIWANASLLHVSKTELIEILPKLYKSLAENAYLYFSLKPSDVGYREDIISGRFFAKYSKDEIIKILQELRLPIEKIWITDSTIENGQKWLNILIKKSF